MVSASEKTRVTGLQYPRPYNRILLGAMNAKQITYILQPLSEGLSDGWRNDGTVCLGSDRDVVQSFLRPMLRHRWHRAWSCFLTNMANAVNEHSGNERSKHREGDPVIAPDPTLALIQTGLRQFILRTPAQKSSPPLPFSCPP